jgi:hypothetical protein
MTTTKEFKTLNGLSDSAFNRLTNKIKADFPEQELTRRINSHDWLIVDVALFEQYLSYQRPEASPVKSEAIDAEFVDEPVQTSIQILSSEKLNALDSLTTLASGLEVYKRPEISLNGSQDEAVELVTELATRVVSMKTVNDLRDQALQERKQNLEKIQATVQHLATVGKSQELKAQDINDEARTVAATELDLKKQLAEILKALS